MQELLKKLLGLLLQMNKKPRSGYGKTVIFWEGNEIICIETTDRESYR